MMAKTNQPTNAYSDADCYSLAAYVLQRGEMVEIVATVVRKRRRKRKWALVRDKFGRAGWLPMDVLDVEDGA